MCGQGDVPLLLFLVAVRASSVCLLFSCDLTNTTTTTTTHPQNKKRFTWLLTPVSAGGAGCASEPELLQGLFNAAAGLCKALSKHITTTTSSAAAALPATLKHTAGLRYHPEHHVRCLAAETFGFLLRTAPRKALRAGMRALLAEHAVRPSRVRAHGAGLMIAEAVLGPEHGLHSRTGAVLSLLLDEQLLSVADFGAAAQKVSKVAAAAGAVGSKQQQEEQEQEGRPAKKARSNSSNSSSKAAAQPPPPAAAAVRASSSMMSEETLRLRCAAVAAVALERLWQHTRRRGQS